MQHSNRRIGEFTVAGHDSRESTIDVIGHATGGDDHGDSDGNLDLPTLEDLLSEAKATRCVAVSEPSQGPQKPTDSNRLVHNGNLKGGLPVGDSAAGQSLVLTLMSAVRHTAVRSNPHSRTSYQ